MKLFLLFLVGPAIPGALAQGAKISLARPVPLPQRKALQWPAANTATTGLGFFCRQELKMDKRTAVPVRFRLGSMQQADWLERKPNAVKPQQ